MKTDGAMENRSKEANVTAEMSRLSLRVLGRVQGVGFRFFVRKVATDLSLSGWVRNESDGSVFVVAEGPVDALNRFVESIRTGPPASNVSEVEESWSDAQGAFEAFRVRHW
jgi:acylphosphatase